MPLDGGTRSQKLTFGEMRETGVSRVIVFCSDYRCSHSTRLSANRWTGHLGLSDIEPQFVCQACGKRGADVRPLFEQARVGTRMTAWMCDQWLWDGPTPRPSGNGSERKFQPAFLVGSTSSSRASMVASSWIRKSRPPVYSARSQTHAPRSWATHAPSGLRYRYGEGTARLRKLRRGCRNWRLDLDWGWRQAAL
jgi:hypothetical protein